MKKQFLAAALGLMLSGCAMIQGTPNVLPPHPGQLSAFDGSVYDGLLATKGAIDNARQQMSAGTLPPNYLATVNGAVAVYNATQSAWVAWRTTVQQTPANLTSGASFTILQQDYAQLLQSLAALKNLGGGE